MDQVVSNWQSQQNALQGLVNPTGSPLAASGNYQAQANSSQALQQLQSQSFEQQLQGLSSSFGSSLSQAANGISQQVSSIGQQVAGAATSPGGTKTTGSPGTAGTTGTAKPPATPPAATGPAIGSTVTNNNSPGAGWQLIGVKGSTKTWQYVGGG